MKMEQVEARTLADLLDASGPSQPVDTDFGKAVASQIERENALLDHRLTWTLQLNGFLFTAMGFLGAKELTDKALQSLVNTWIPVTGCVVSLACLLGVIAAQMQLDYLAKFWVSASPRECLRPFGDRAKGPYLLGMLPSFMPPGILLATWCMYLINSWLTR
jgi:hypothetical protein